MRAAALVEVQEYGDGARDEREDLVEICRLLRKNVDKGALGFRLIRTLCGRDEFLDALESLCGIGLHALANRVYDFRRDTCDIRREGRRLGGTSVSPTHGGERTRAGEHFKEHCP